MSWAIALPPEASPEPDCLSTVQGDKELTREHRLDVYVNAYRSRLIEAISKDFSTCFKALGEERFEKIIFEYVEARPSTSFNIVDVGENLPKFLSEHPILEEFPFLEDLASLEWLVLQSFFAENLPVLSTTKLQGLSPESYSTATFKIDPAVFVFKSRWKLKIGESDRPVKEETLFLISRKDYDVEVETLDQAEFLLLEAFRSGKTLQTICEDLESRNITPSQIQAAFARFIQGGVIQDVVLAIGYDIACTD
jgi:hypothetical protein